MTQNQLRKLIRRARSGNAHAQAELNKYSRKIAKIDNERMRQLRKKDIATELSDSAEYFLSLEGRRSFSEGKNLWDRDTGEEELLLMNKIYNTNITVGEINKRRKSAVASFRKHGYEIPLGYEKTFFNFLRSDLFKEYILFDSERAVESIISKLRITGAREKLDDLWNQYQANEITMGEAWRQFERWEGVK